MGWGTSFGSDLLHALNLCLSCCYVTPGVTPFAQTHPPVMSEGELALPAGVGRIGRSKALEDGEVFAERGQRLVEAALRLQDVADLGMSDGEVALPAGVGRVG